MSLRTQQILESLRKQIDESRTDTLPPLRHLAQQLGISVPTLRPILQQLRREQLIRFRRGSKVRIVGRVTAGQDNPGKPSHEKMADVLRDMIRTGSIRTGEAIPKQSFLALKHKVSPTTVRKACHRLSREGWMHKKGKSYIAGDLAASGRRNLDGASGFIYIFAAKWHSWDYLCRSTRTSEFGMSFVRESQRYNVRLILVTRDANSKDTGKPPLSLAAALRLIGSQGSLCRGVLLACSLDEWPEVFESTIEKLIPRRIRVIWFDRYNEKRSASIRSPNLVRCHFDELPAVSEAVGYLHGKGHRKWAYCMTRHSDWQQTRAQLLIREAKRKDPSIELCSYLDILCEPDPAQRRRRLFDALKQLRSSPHTSIREAAEKVDPLRLLSIAPDIPLAELSTQERIVRCSLMLYPMLVDSGISVIISPNDLTARRVHRPCLATLGLKVPQSISMLGFDNSYRYSFYPLTSIDFGFERLGYAAFHLLLQDIPLYPNRSGDVSIRPVVSEKGSVVAPE